MRSADGDGSTLVLRSNGDPAFGDTEVLKELDPPLTPDDALDQFAAGAVGAAPIGRVAQLVVDDRVFDREGVHADWPRDQLERFQNAWLEGRLHRSERQVGLIVVVIIIVIGNRVAVGIKLLRRFFLLFTARDRCDDRRARLFLAHLLAEGCL